MKIQMTHVSARLSAGHRITLTAIVREGDTALATVAFDSAASAPDRRWTIFSVPGTARGRGTAQARLLSAAGMTLGQMHAWLDQQAQTAIQVGLATSWRARHV